MMKEFCPSPSAFLAPPLPSHVHRLPPLMKVHRREATIQQESLGYSAGGAAGQGRSCFLFPSSSPATQNDEPRRKTRRARLTEAQNLFCSDSLSLIHHLCTAGACPWAAVFNEGAWVAGPQQLYYCFSSAPWQRQRQDCLAGITPRRRWNRNPWTLSTSVSLSRSI